MGVECETLLLHTEFRWLFRSKTLFEYKLRKEIEERFRKEGKKEFIFCLQNNA